MKHSLKGFASDGLHARWNSQFLQAGTTIKCINRNFLQGVRQSHLLQRRTAPECSRLQFLQAVRQLYLFQRCRITECITSNRCYRIWNGNGSKFRLRKCPRSNGLQARWQRYICQIRSRSKRIRCDFCNRIWYSISCFCFCRRIAEQRCLSRIHQDSIFNRKCRISVFNRKCLQADAISKYIFSQCCQGCRNGNALQRYTVEKSKVADALQRL